MSKNLDILTYRIDTLERKLENIERLLLSNQVGPATTANGKDGITTEILHVLLDMVKMKSELPVQQVQQKPAAAQKQSSNKVEDPTAVQSSDENDNCKGDLFGFQRRRSIV